ncbi:MULTISPECIES: hypothetical protein [unclassified Streptomyces]|uniref:hypothetical protein n=1 Tax=unclassified Streptomyces TaxID=2593676 RepID=UPI001164EE3C|nr:MULTISPECIES: hypothetical protein [unclassified Streptomyces]QDO58214.1 hypothetical protein FNV59_08800 [Streptomyces sp. RLB1-8]NMI55926.1 hypothetical protein [Streptomyces sp. RLA2-12]QDN55389.1 hypothetical protein FNV67_08720 [Streptomyces sp. S1D4-20]QDN65567.1 hypothetical protein FNV66_08315 [Streptomyces sp. S1D4-14]QDN96211.1 hypothetical protein FNV58_09455 [Streptomyces sp. RLB1-9]
MTPHPAGIVQLRPEPNRLTIRLADEPYVIHHWADRVLPVVDPGGGDPRDEIAGVYGLRYRITGSRVVLYRPGSQAQIRLHGFSPGWWERAATRRRREYAGSTFDTPHWTEHESRAHQLTQEAGWEPAGLLSPLLRRIRATAGDGPFNGTSVWFNEVALRLETTHGPACAQLTALLCKGPTTLGWTVQRQTCFCLSERAEGCSINFTAPGEPPIQYTNLRWGARFTKKNHQRRLAELNARALLL